MTTERPPVSDLFGRFRVLDLTTGIAGAYASKLLRLT